MMSKLRLTVAVSAALLGCGGNVADDPSDTSEVVSAGSDTSDGAADFDEGTADSDDVAADSDESIAAGKTITAAGTGGAAGAPATSGPPLDGAGGAAGAAGAGSPSDACGYPNYPPASFDPGPWQPHVYSADTSEQEILADIQDAMVGSWRGIATTPWTTPYEVSLQFHADGSYEAQCSTLPADCCAAFYYGSDLPYPGKHYALDDVNTLHQASGTIDITFSPDGQLPAWQGLLKHIERDATGNRLRLAFARSDGYGDVTYDLARIDP